MSKPLLVALFFIGVLAILQVEDPPPTQRQEETFSPYYDNESSKCECY